MTLLTQKDQKILSNAELSVDEKERFGLFYNEHRKFAVGDLKGNKQVCIETNWNPFVGKNQYLKIRVGEEEVIVVNEDLRSILKILAPLKDADEMLVHSRRFYTTRKQLLGVRLSRNYRKGEQVTVEIDVPERLS